MDRAILRRKEHTICTGGSLIEKENSCMVEICDDINQEYMFWYRNSLTFWQDQATPLRVLHTIHNVFDDCLQDACHCCKSYESAREKKWTSLNKTDRSYVCAVLFIAPPSNDSTLLLHDCLLARTRTPEPRRRLTDLTVITGPNTHHTGVDGAGHAVLELHVELRQSVRIEHTGIPHVTLATSLDDVAYLIQKRN